MSRRFLHTPLGTAFVGAVLAFGLAHCAEGIPAPEPETPDAGLGCGRLDQRMPRLFGLLRDPSKPLAGLREVVVAIAKAKPNALVDENVVGVLLDAAVTGLREFTDDPGENDPAVPTSCLSEPPTDLPLCRAARSPPRVGDGPACESRLCAFRRGIDLGVGDQRMVDAIEALRPMLVKVLRYMDPSDGDGHLEVVRVLHNSSKAEGICAPENLVELLDGLVLYFRSNPTCAQDGSCTSYRALEAVREILADPTLQQFLTSYESGRSGGSRRAFQVLGRQLLVAIANTPEDETYFQQIRSVVDTLLSFLRDPKYDTLRPRVEALVALVEEFLDPHRPNAILRPLKGVANCLANENVDPEMEIVGGLYDLLSAPKERRGLDLDELVEAVEGVNRADPNGVLAGAIHAVLYSWQRDDVALDAVRRFFSEALTEEKSRLALPAFIVLLENDVIGEFVRLLDDLLYGCTPDEDS